MLKRKTVALMLLAGLAAAVAGCVQDRRAEPPAVAAAPRPAPRQEPAATRSAAPAAPRHWDAFLVAGSNAQPVFDNFVADFGKELASNGTRVARFSSRQPLPDGAEPAIQAHIRASAPPSASPDAGCLMYFTSHGTRDGRIEMALDTVNRRSMSASTLAETIATLCGQRPTVVVLSACYAGSLLTGKVLAEHRIVIAAAHKDRQSFGCASSRHLNHFDQCFLAAWRDAEDWRGLFAATHDCVRWSEQRGKERPSEPQAVFGRAALDLALPGKPRAAN